MVRQALPATRAGRVRHAAQRLKEFSMKELTRALKARTPQERRLVMYSTRDFLRRGELERIGYARYRYHKWTPKITLRQRLWDVARRMVNFSPRDLEQLTGIKMSTVRDFCCWMIAAGYARYTARGHYKITGRLKPTAPIAGSWKEKKKEEKCIAV